MRLGVIDFSEKYANIGTLFWATVNIEHISPPFFAQPLAFLA